MKVSGADMARVETVLLDGVDVTDKCQEASELKGYVICELVNTDGQAVLDSLGRPKLGGFSGKVEITLQFEAP